jgi:hypothetical protein
MAEESLGEQLYLIQAGGAGQQEEFVTAGGFVGV